MMQPSNPSEETPETAATSKTPARSAATSAANSAANSAAVLSGASVGRLSLYYRELHRLRDSESTNVNSQELGRLVDVSPAVVRRDLSALGTIGRRGVGYEVETLIESIGQVLGSGKKWKVVLVGVGSLGDALLRYRGFERLGFRLVAAYDSDPRKIGAVVADVPIYDAETMEQSLRSERPELAILAVPSENAIEIAATLVRCQIHGILNFAPTTLKLPGNVAVVNVDLASELQRLVFAVQTQHQKT
ncbi:Redox-sensing transcriptional repressor Rex [Rubripirellula obstinata]|uniref:Redox-sensing transcriptional repressor Rex n=1 Tax=Rubripirellula obstinata TaxID=406547 RepID=A0A5B1CCV1_9BACT|nr:redox-sensing transcriptional repressor Rex [Rubripirellula obstinata]KAA1258957.1 Redox-sensing transcriptional repressor Rex [Rubripirellula obstinata]